MKCKGEIVAPVGIVGKTRMSFSELMGKIWEAIIAHNNRLQVDTCIKCGDLQIDGVWIESPPLLRDAVTEGAVTVNGKLLICDRCANCVSAHSMVYGLKE